ncbi:MAG: 4Fe-4S dicluster domain-containing protein [Burkholderiales bacterium]|nr:4Fe-4S dicluster domain-containing protein [Burkholderiales bacterium]
MAQIRSLFPTLTGELPDGIRPDRAPAKAAAPSVTTPVVGEIPQFDQREQQHTKAAIGALGEKIQQRWTSESVDPFRRVFYPENRPFNSPLRSLLAVAEGPLNPKRIPVNDPAKMAAHIKEVAKFFGADLVGVCELKRHHVYSHRGLRIDARKNRWGEPIALDHRYAISLAHQMNHERMRYSPSFIDGAEVGFGYLESAKTATSLACYIRELGYPATAHFHVSERVLQVPIAVEAGLGELARNNCLITREFGPRQRLATVTTDLPLAVDRRADLGVQQLCEMCDKCAALCPSQCLPRGPKQVERGYLHWVADNDKCITYWNANREKWNDCARCITVCPLNRPPGAWMRFATWALRRGRLLRKLVLNVDDLFWNKRYHLKAGKGWLMYDRTTSAKKFESGQIHPNA